ncbi:hypothetical protein HFP89_01355 [Wenzhouxiangella sp. XN79A]|uniref:hypothetical protein n=1 Tax=Wenzhouxiangella sp. XN79A TaxID=2724193 RepID=UPI00144AC547|nr:hypothetical protein [Wenzhouxiangella sp. XN79A]NKI33810.1 hypothetical protein [Wenzhouxiangella sp. XN79A]
MKPSQEHRFEMLLLIAALAIVRMPSPDTAPAAALPIDPATGAGRPAASIDNAELRSSPQRLDPVGLLQAGVPEHWRVPVTELPYASVVDRAC